jgi:hypothetical protein
MITKAEDDKRTCSGCGGNVFNTEMLFWAMEIKKNNLPDIIFCIDCFYELGIEAKRFLNNRKTKTEGENK